MVKIKVFVWNENPLNVRKYHYFGPIVKRESWINTVNNEQRTQPSSRIILSQIAMVTLVSIYHYDSIAKAKVKWKEFKEIPPFNNDFWD